MKFLVGADPELFVLDKVTGKFVSAHGMIEGDKKNPLPVPNGAVQVDGMALEFNINPANTLEEFQQNIQRVQESLSQMIEDKYSIEALPSVVFDEDVWTSTPDEAKVLGCDPDSNAYLDGSDNPVPDGDSTTMRTGAGHIHVGWGEGMRYTSEHNSNCISVVKQLDCSLGLQSLSWDDDDKRRSLYGKAGAFRLKSYGVEYRVLSNAWLRSQELVKHVYDTTMKSLTDLTQGNRYLSLLDEEEVQHVINNNDKARAKQMTQQLFETYGVGHV